MVLGALASGLKQANLTGIQAAVVSGDLFDSSDIPLDDAQSIVRSFVEILRSSMGDENLSVVLLPGNHDRRTYGVVGPNVPTLFETLQNAAMPGVRVVGVDAGRLVLPVLLDEFPALIHAHDSTYLAGGVFGAGGTIRAEDVLYVASHVECESTSMPLFWFTHHHLIPTPVTDVGRIDTEKRSLLVKASVGALSHIVAYGDREEIFMTAMGAGSALSMMHAMGRPVLVLHGHKHYPTSRLLRATLQEHGDVAIVSAGSSGLEEAWRSRDSAKPLYLWPSFNVVRFDGVLLDVEMVAFPYRALDKPIARRTLLRARKEGLRWEPQPYAPATEIASIARNEAVYKIAPSRADNNLFDIECTRFIEAAVGAAYEDMADHIEGMDGSSLDWCDGRSVVSLPQDVLLPQGQTRFVLQRAASRSRVQAAKAYEVGTAYEWVGFVNRRWTTRAMLRLEGDPLVLGRTFASRTDLVTGSEVPVHLYSNDPGAVHIIVEPCPARTWLRIYWVLD